MAKKEGPTYPVSSLEKSILILNGLEKIGRPAGISELSNFTGLGISIIHRHLDTLAFYRFVEQDPITSKYRLGIRLFELGESVLQQMVFLERVHPYLNELMLLANETVNLSILDHDQVIFIDKIECQATLRAVTHIGKSVPLYCSGMGKAMLAFLPEEKREFIFENIKFISYTEKTITDMEKLRENLLQISRNGYALDDEEYYPGIRCVGVPILDKQGYAIASISISGPATRMTDEHIEHMLPKLLSTAKKISTEFGNEKLMRASIKKRRDLEIE